MDLIHVFVLEGDCMVIVYFSLLTISFAEISHQQSHFFNLSSLQQCWQGQSKSCIYSVGFDTIEFSSRSY